MAVAVALAACLRMAWQHPSRDVIASTIQTSNAETCCEYNMLKLSRNLFLHTADPKYMQYYERTLYGQILASRLNATSSTNPNLTYFIPMNPGAVRSFGNLGTCCGGTGLESHEKFMDSIYFSSVDDSTLYVNLYIPSTLEWREKGFTIEQATRYPFEGASTLTVRGNGRLAMMLRVPSWVRRGYTVTVNGTPQQIAATPGKYVKIDRPWRDGDKIEIGMPMSFRAERTIDDPSVQSIFYGPTLLAVQAAPVGDTLETGLINVSLYKNFKLSGDFATAMTPVADKPLHFTFNGQTLAPFFVSDPQAGQSQPYHMYLRRQEPIIVFGTVDTGVANSKRDDGVSFLDAVWTGASFADHGRFVAAVERVATEWAAAGKLAAMERRAVVDAARRAEKDMS